MPSMEDEKILEKIVTSGKHCRVVFADLSKLSFEDIPVDVSPAYSGQRIRKEQMYVELGGPKVKYKFELLRVVPLDRVEDGKITIIGPDLNELEEGKSYPYGVYIEVAGRDLEPEAEGVLERRIHEYSNMIEGYMHLNQRYDIWLRVSKSSYKKGLTSFRYIGTVLMRLYKSEFPMIEKIQITFITDPTKVEEMWKIAMSVYEERDRRALTLRDEDVDVFYGCRLCQSFAPTHVCIITPERPANCGAITWFDGRVAVKIDPKGPIFVVPKGKLIDPVYGEYEGCNEAVKKYSGGAVTRVRLYTAFDYEHTSCGCFEAVTFYIPEVDGLGIVHRGFSGITPVGLKFADIADAASGGRQVPGFHGISVLYMHSRKFLQADGGWERIVWMPSELKERVLRAIPENLRDKIATDKDVKSVDELKKFLMEKGHPIIKRWKTKEEEVKEVVAKEEVIKTTPTKPSVEIPTSPQIPIPIASEALQKMPVVSSGMGFRIILKNAKIRAGRVIIRSKSKLEAEG